MDTGQGQAATNTTIQSSNALDTVQAALDATQQATPAVDQVPVAGGSDTAAATVADQATAQAVPPTQKTKMPPAGPQNASYGAFLEHTTEAPKPNLLDPGNSLLSSAFSTAAWLCVLLGCIFLAYWLLRRFGPRGIARGRGADSPRLMGRLMMGQRQHVDVIRVHGRTFLLGVTEANINLLSEIEPQPGQCFDDEDEDEFTNFTEMLGKQSGDSSGD